MSTRLLRANSSARLGVSNSSRFSLPSIWRTISASRRRLLNRSSMMRTVLRWARASASSEMTPVGRACAAFMVFSWRKERQQLSRRKKCAPAIAGRVQLWTSCLVAGRESLTRRGMPALRDFGAPRCSAKGPPGFPGGAVMLVGARGFEPPTPCTPCRCATRLRYAPTRTANYSRVHRSRPSS